jgi:hypothetical protein
MKLPADTGPSLDRDRISTTSNADVRFWHKADIPITRANGRYWGKSGHRGLMPSCLLLTQSGHSSPYALKAIPPDD